MQQQRHRRLDRAKKPNWRERKEKRRGERGQEKVVPILSRSLSLSRSLAAFPPAFLIQNGEKFPREFGRQQQHQHRRRMRMRARAAWLARGTPFRIWATWGLIQ